MGFFKIRVFFFRGVGIGWSRLGFIVVGSRGFCRVGEGVKIFGLGFFGVYFIVWYVYGFFRIGVVWDFGKRFGFFGVGFMECD